MSPTTAPKRAETNADHRKIIITTSVIVVALFYSPCADACMLPTLIVLKMSAVHAKRQAVAVLLCVLHSPERVTHLNNICIAEWGFFYQMHAPPFHLRITITILVLFKQEASSALQSSKAISL